MDDQRLEASRGVWKTIVGSTVTALTVIGGVLGILSYMSSYSKYDLNGEWTIINTIKSTTYHPYQNLKLGYHVFLTQDGTDITGTGEKWSENGKELVPSAHTPITMRGSIKGTKVTATFREDGTDRKTEGTFGWTYQSGTQSLSGSFTSTAADSSGPSDAQRAAPEE